MNSRSSRLAKEKERLVATIAMQRAELEIGMEPVRTALHTMDRVRAATSYVTGHLPLLGVGLSMLLLTRRRRPARRIPTGGIFWRTAQWGLKASRWWSRWKMLASVVPYVKRL